MIPIPKSHLLTCDHWEKDQVLSLLIRADALKALPIDELPPCLQHKTLVNLFYEPSTRTRASFELAAKQLGAMSSILALPVPVLKKAKPYGIPWKLFKLWGWTA